MKNVIVLSSTFIVSQNFLPVKVSCLLTIFIFSCLQKVTFPLLIFHSREEEQTLTAAHMFEDETLNSKCLCRPAACCLLQIGRLLSGSFSISGRTSLCLKQNGSSLLATTHCSLQTKNFVYLFQTASSRETKKAAELSK